MVPLNLALPENVEQDCSKLSKYILHVLQNIFLMWKQYRMINVEYGSVLK